MRVFLAHLRKEWREHRAVLLGVAVAIPFLLAVGCAAFTGFAYGLPLILHLVLAGGTALTALALATELWPGESRRDGLALLRRTPGGVRAAFAAKTVFFVAAGAATAAWTAACALGAAQALAGAATRWDAWRQLTEGSEVFAPAGAVLVVGLWAILASTWVPRGAAAVGLGALLLGALVAPAALVLDRYGWQPLAGNLSTWPALGFAAAVPLLATLASLLRALDRGRGHGRACVVGAATVLALAVPAYAWGAVRLEAWRSLDPSDPDLDVLAAVVGKGGRYAYLTVDRMPPGGRRSNAWESPTLRPWRVDLETGAWIEMGDLGDCVGGDWTLPEYRNTRPTAGVVAVRRAWGSMNGYDRKAETVRWWDAEKGEIWRTLPSAIRPPELVERFRDDLRRAAVVRRPDGSPAWLLLLALSAYSRQQRIEWDGVAGLESATLDPDVYAGLPGPIGWSGLRRSGDSWGAVWFGFDERGSIEVAPWAPTVPRTRRLVPISARIALEGPASRRVAGVDGWVLRRRNGEGAAEETVPLSSIGGEDGLVDALESSTMLVLRREAGGARQFPFLVDVVEDRARPCALPGPLAAVGITETLLAGWTPSGDAVLRVIAGNGRMGLALLSPRTAAIRGWLPDLPASGLWFVDDETAIAWVGKTLVRVDWRTGTTRQVFPRR